MCRHSSYSDMYYTVKNILEPPPTSRRQRDQMWGRNKCVQWMLKQYSGKQLMRPTMTCTV